MLPSHRAQPEDGAAARPDRSADADLLPRSQTLVSHVCVVQRRTQAGKSRLGLFLFCFNAFLLDFRLKMIWLPVLTAVMMMMLTLFMTARRRSVTSGLLKKCHSWLFQIHF